MVKISSLNELWQISDCASSSFSLVPLVLQFLFELISKARSTTDSVLGYIISDFILDALQIGFNSIEFD